MASRNHFQKIVKKLPLLIAAFCTLIFSSCNITIDQEISCFEGSDGQLTASPDITIIGEAIYVWSTGDSTATISGLSAGTYTVSIYDSGDESFLQTDTETLENPTILEANITIDQHETETVGNDGVLTATGSGGTVTDNYSYEWSTEVSTATISGLTAGTYTVTVTDDNGCTATATEEVIHLASLYGQVWLDLNRDGVYDDYEVGIPNAALRLFQCEEDELGAETSIDSTELGGDYAFEDVLPGEYCIEIDPSTSDITYTAAGHTVTTFTGTQELGRTASSSINLMPGENTDLYNIGVFYDACYPPYNLASTDCTETGATLSWQTINTDPHDGIDDHCWKVVVAGAGPQHAEFAELGLFLDFLGAGLHFSLIEFSICADDPALTVEEGDVPGTYKLTYQLSNTLIQPGTSYWFAIAEICDDMPAAGNNSLWNFQRPSEIPISSIDDGPFYDPDNSTTYLWDDYEGYFQTKDDQFEASVVIQKTTCPEESPAYTADACIIVTIEDGETCWGLYNIYIDDEIQDQGGDETYGPGTYSFCQYGVGPHDVEVRLVSDCNPPEKNLKIDATIPNGVDTESPKIIVTDFFATSLIADNVAESMVDTFANLGEMIIPEGACSMKTYYHVMGVDNCDGEITASNALTYDVVASAENVDPGTQVNIYEDSEEMVTGNGVVTVNNGEWVIEINWAVGQSTVEVCMDDLEEAGLSAPACITITADVNDNIEPIILMTPINMLVPACRDDATSFFDITILDGCDGYIDPDQLEVAIAPEAPIEFFELGFVEENGTIQLQVDFTGEEDLDYPIGGPYSIIYTDDNGDEYESEGLIVINKAAEETDPIITASGNAFTALACEDGGEVVIGVTVTDDCDDITDDLKISGLTGLSAATPILNGLSGYFEFSGTLEPEEYTLTFTYPGADDVEVLVIVSQEDNKAPGIDMPGNTTFTIPSCQSTVKAVWSVQITDDCDEEIDLDKVLITIGGDEITVPSSAATILSAGDGMVLIELNADLSLAENGAVFAVSYEDGDGETTSKQSTVTVNGTPDVVPPVIVYPTEAISVELDPCGPSTTDIKFSVSAIDNCAGAVSVDVEAIGSLAMYSSPEGDAVKWTITYPAAATPYTITLTATDGVGNTTEQTMWVSVTQGPTPPQNLACNTGLTAPVSTSCAVELTPDMVLEGTFGCLTPADVEIVVDGKERGDASANYTEGTGVHEFDIYLGGAYFCTGTITTHDNIEPVIECPQTYIDFICTDIDELSGTLEFTGEPSIFDNCEGASYTWYEETLYGADEACDDVQIKRVFTVTDAAGLTDECTQYINIRKPTLADVIAPDEVVELSCDDDFVYDDEGHPVPLETGGYPYVETHFDDHNLAQTYCNLVATYEDTDLIEICEDSYKFIRTWKVIDWCNPTVQDTYTQLIKVGDFEDPIITPPTADYDWDGELDVLEFSIGPFDCEGAFEVPLPTVLDNCSSDLTITTEVLEDGSNPIIWIEQGESRFVNEIPAGCHAFRYWVTDGCGNQADIIVPFVVFDKVAPVAICNDDLHISISNEDAVRIYAAEIDEGSWDNCTAVKFQVRRIANGVDCSTSEGGFTPWADYIDFSCCDIGTQVRVELRVWDDANLDGFPGSVRIVGTCSGEEIEIADNSNTCWLDVTVEDKLNPHCIPPPDQFVSCAELPYDFDPNEIELLEDLFGEAEYSDNCTVLSGLENTPVITIDDCGVGTILRSFTATDASGLTSADCQQLITINAVHNYEIGFPADAAADCSLANPDTIITKEIGCDILAISIEDEIFSASGDECYKVFRTYRVINWCEYDGEAPPVIVSRDEDCDGKPGDEAIWVIRRNSGAVYFDRDNDENNNSPSAGTKGIACDGLSNPHGYWIDSTIDKDADRDPITGQEDNSFTNDNIRNIDSRGYWQYTQVIKVYDSVDPVITVEAYDTFESLDNVDCDGLVTINFSIEDECTVEESLQYVWLDAFIVDEDNDGNFTQAEFVPDADMTSSVTGEAADYTFAAELPQGRHALLVKGTDGCGNEAVDLMIFEVVDTKGPAPICINGLAIELMPTAPGSDADGDGVEDAAAMTIWANDFIASPIYDCNGQGPAVDSDGNELIRAYSINLVGEDPDRATTALVLTCDSEETTLVEIHAWDEVGNHDFCETYVLVQDQMDICSNGDGAIAGFISTEEEEEVSGVEVSLNGYVDGTMTTGDNGYFEFRNLPLSDYSVVPQLDKDYLNGVSTLDLILITKHIMGIEPLASPYKLIAADINNSKNITTLDIIIARQNILGISDGFTNNTSWRFVDADYVFPIPENPWLETFPEIKSFNNLEGEEVINFYAVKIGDVNTSAKTQSLFSFEDRTTSTFALEIEDVLLAANHKYEIPFSAADIAQIAGFQGTFTFGKAIEVIDIQYGVLKEENFGEQFLTTGLLPVSWNDNAKAEDLLFTLVIKANANAQLSEQIGLSSSITPTEAYTIGGELSDLALRFSNGETKTVNFELYQNYPNPFIDDTAIRFHLPEAMEATLQIQDLNGKTVRSIRNNFAKGYNIVRLKADGVFPQGPLFYTLSAGEYTSTRKMIFLK